ncbi:MAG: M1 family metallopeptidase [Bacteroidales bacterium]|nr:M1 family metallopeptidase [Bacteroidales bacterium]
MMSTTIAAILRKILSLFFIFVFIQSNLFSQNFTERYRSSENPYYWKNRKPHEAYWQQDVNYNIKIRLDDQKDILYGSMRLIYYNNSPDTLSFVYFHLYQNAFLPNSHYHHLQQDNKSIMSFGTYQSLGLGTEVEQIIVDGENHEWILDNTIMRVNLNKPIKSNDSAVFDIQFKTYFNHDAGWGRMRLYQRWGFKHFNGAHFYPRISVYDSRFGWTADQHLVHEFYGDFGTYSVELDLPENYITEATGTLMNEEEVLPDDLRERLDIKNFKDKAFNSPPDIIIPYDSTKRKIWKYYAINVHDFAFVASPTYRLSEVDYQGVKCVAIAHESHASRWQNAAELTANIIALYNEKIGTYAYPKMVVADAFSGMEYPMLTMNSDYDPEYSYIFSHEIGHNWFFGMVGSNETYAALLDEGFTQYLTIYALDKLSEIGPIESEITNRYLRKHSFKPALRDRHSYLRYHRHALGTKGITLNTHSDMFSTNRPYGEEYRQTYYKGSVMLMNLEYVLGKDLFNKAIKDYFEQWKFCHPYIEDMRASFIHSTQTDLNWFFDAFIETPKVIDYKVKNVRKNRKTDTYTVNFRRYGDMQMPIDFTVVGKNDSLYYYHIPNTDFIKNTNAVILPKWYGWLHFNREYAAEITIPSGIKNVIIDSSHTLADIYAPDNSLRKQIKLSFDYLIDNIENRNCYEMYYRPDLWWNSVDGLKTGVNLNGHYMKLFHVFDLSIFYNTGLLQQISKNKPWPASYVFEYKTPLSRRTKNTYIGIKSLLTDGFSRQALKLDYNIPQTGSTVYLEFKSLYRPENNLSNSYPLYPKEWRSPNVDNTHSLLINNIMSLGFQSHYHNVLRNGSLDLTARTSFFSPYDFSTLSLSHINNENMNLLTFRSRIYAQWAFGTHMPKESMLYLSGANQEEMAENKFTRSSGIFPASMGGYGLNTSHFHEGGGLNIRGYAGYVAAQTDMFGNVVPTYRGHSGIALNTEMEFDRLFKIKPKYLSDYLRFCTYIFADAGFISMNKISDRLQLSQLRMSAGLGLAMTIKKFGPFTKLKPITIRCDMPLFLNRPPAIDNDFINLRWIIGVKRAF